MKELFKILVFMSGLIFLGGLAICFGGAMLDDLSRSGSDYLELEKKRQINYLNTLKANADKTPIDGRANWQYSQVLKTAEAKAILNWSDAKQQKQVAYYLKRAFDVSATEAIAQVGYDQLKKGFGYGDDDRTEFDSDKIINIKAIQTGLQHIHQATRTTCESHFRSVYSSGFDDAYHDGYDEKGNVIDYAEVESLVKNPALAAYPKLLTQAKLLWLHDQVNCSENYHDIKRNLIDDIVHKRGAKDSDHITDNFVLATLINEPDIAYLLEKQVLPKDKAKFQQDASAMVTLFEKDYKGFVSKKQQWEKSCCAHKNQAALPAVDAE